MIRPFISIVYLHDFDFLIGPNEVSTYANGIVNGTINNNHIYISHPYEGRKLNKRNMNTNDNNSIRKATHIIRHEFRSFK